MDELTEIVVSFVIGTGFVYLYFKYLWGTRL